MDVSKLMFREGLMTGERILVTGGSQGARVLSEVVPDGLAMLPPALVVVFMQRLFVRGLVETEK